jgi:hypothetical protein
MAREGNTLYIAGAFRSVGENSGGLVPFDARTGQPLRPYTKVAGLINAIVPDGAGGWYIGGQFTAVGGVPRSCVAQVRADGSVTDWNPMVTGSPGYIDPPEVTAIAVFRDRVFVGGGFRDIGGQPHENLGCVDAQTGAALDWNLDINQDGWVYTLLVHDSTLFVGGFFDSLGGQPREGLAAVNGVTGNLTPWHPIVIGSVWALLARVDTLYVGGDFLGINWKNRPMLAAVDVHSGQLLPLDVHASGVQTRYALPPQIHAMVLTNDTLYVGGNFTQIGGQQRTSLAALNVVTGSALDWVADSVGPRSPGLPPRLCSTLAIDGSMLYVGGEFETLAGQSHPFVAALGRATGVASDWNPKLDYASAALGVRGNTVLVGGWFSSVGEWWHRAGLAAIDLATGVLKPWNPNPDGVICTAVAVHDGRVFVSGDFAHIGGQLQPRRYFAALDTVNGEVTDWNPGANDIAGGFLLHGDTLYAGGEFTQIAGQPRNRLAAFNTTTGELTSWDPNANNGVDALALSGTTMYVGGFFNLLGRSQRRYLGTVDAVTGEVLPWNPNPDNYVLSLLVSGNTVYVGGVFSSIGGRPRSSIAAVDVATGTATGWDPAPLPLEGFSAQIQALALSRSMLYVGGNFSSIGGQRHICLAAVDTATGLATDWDPGLDGLVWSLLADGATVYVGGGFSRAAGLPCDDLAAFHLPPTPTPEPLTSRLVITGVWPNPVQSLATVRFALPATAPATLDVYDLQGRLMTTIFRDRMHPAGEEEVSFPTEGWPVGLYLCRLQAGEATASRKLLVVR